MLVEIGGHTKEPVGTNRTNASGFSTEFPKYKLPTPIQEPRQGKMQRQMTRQRRTKRKNPLSQNTLKIQVKITKSVLSNHHLQMVEKNRTL